MLYQEGFWPMAGRCLFLLLWLICPFKALSQTTLQFQEIMPRPTDGSLEYVTITNPTAATINLSGWLIADLAKQNKPLALPDYQLAAGQSWTIDTKTIGLSLNNDQEKLFLWQPDGQLADSLSYTKAPLNIAYQRSSAGWQWAEPMITTESTVAATSSATTQTVAGIVTALPYQLSGQYFYITYPDNAGGLKIYCYYKLWPQLTLGDSIEVAGQLVSTTQEIKLNIKNQSDIKILTASTPLTAKIITSQDQLISGQLVVLTGKLAAKNQSTLYLTDDFGELLVQLKTGSGLKNSDFTVGQTYQITGLALDNNGYRLVPRQPSDVVKINPITSSTAITTLDFSANKKSAASPLTWVVGLAIGLAIGGLAFKMIKK